MGGKALGLGTKYHGGGGREACYEELAGGLRHPDECGWVSEH